MSQVPLKQSLISVSPLILAQLQQETRVVTGVRNGRKGRKAEGPVRVDVNALLNTAFAGSGAALRQSW